MAQIIKIKSNNILYDICPSADAIFERESADNLNPQEWTEVARLGDEDSIGSIFDKISKMFKNIRFLKTLTDSKVSKSGDTITGDLTIGSTTIYSDGSISINTDHATDSATKIIIMDDDGNYYYRTAEELLQDIGGSSGATVTDTTLILP